MLNSRPLGTYALAGVISAAGVCLADAQISGTLYAKREGIADTAALAISAAGVSNRTTFILTTSNTQGSAAIIAEASEYIFVDGYPVLARALVYGQTDVPGAGSLDAGAAVVGWANRAFDSSSDLAATATGALQASTLNAAAAVVTPQSITAGEPTYIRNGITTHDASSSYTISSAAATNSIAYVYSELTIEGTSEATGYALAGVSQGGDLQAQAQVIPALSNAVRSVAVTMNIGAGATGAAVATLAIDGQFDISFTQAVAASSNIGIGFPLVTTASAVATADAEKHRSGTGALAATATGDASPSRVGKSEGSVTASGTAGQLMRIANDSIQFVLPTRRLTISASSREQVVVNSLRTMEV